MIENEILISVLITVKDGERFIDDAIAGFLNQTISRGFEIVIVDDGSVDKTRDVINKYKMSEEHDILNIKYHYNPNPGRGKALNLGVLKSSGEYISIFDIDDYAHPERIETELQLIKSFPETSVLAGEIKLFKDLSELQVSYSLAKSKLVVKKLRNEFAKYNPVCHSASLLKKKDLLSVGGYSENRESQFDYDLWVKMLEAGHIIGRYNKLITYKRIHNQQSFEANKHFSYLLRSFEVQKRAGKVLDQRVVCFFYIFLRIINSFIPRWLRMLIRKKINR